MLTLFQIMTLDSWGKICFEVMDEGFSGIAVIFVLFIIFTHFTVLNLFVAVIVEHVQQFSSISDYELICKMENNQKTLCNKLRDCFNAADINHDQRMTSAEFEVLLEDPDVKNIVQDSKFNLPRFLGG